MKPHIQRVFGGEMIGIYWTCRSVIMSPVEGIGATPKEAYLNWRKRRWTASRFELPWWF